MAMSRSLCGLLLLVVVVSSASATAQGPGCSTVVNPLVPSLLQAVGFSPSCITAALVSCNLDDNHETSFIKELRDTAAELREAVKENEKSKQRPRHCKDLLDSGDTGAGIRQVHPFVKHPKASVSVYCDQTTDGGGWTVFQRRRNLTEREDFYRTWVEYQLGFGHMEGEFWLGLDLLHQLTATSLQEMRVDLEDYEGEHKWAKYGKFYVGPASDLYRISVGRYTGTAGNGLGEGRHDGHQFSTHDSDHDADGTNCAQAYKGGWWYDKCHISNLNGYHYEGHHDSYADGINWRPWREYHYSLRETIMMIRPAF